MSHRWPLWLLAIALPALLIACVQPAISRLPPILSFSTSLQSISPPEQILQLQVHELPYSTIYTLRIPTRQFVVQPAIAAGVDSLADFAQRHGAIAVLNGGFFDPANQQSTSYVTINGQRVADPRDNARLTDNPQLAPYLDQIFDRSELRRDRCGNEAAPDPQAVTLRYSIAAHSAPPSAGCEPLDALGGGPQLLPTLTAEAEAFVSRADGRLIRDPIGINQRNARTAVAILTNGDLLWVMAAQLPQRPQDSGMSLTELADFMGRLGVERALNLDGGSSSSLYYSGQDGAGQTGDGQTGEGQTIYGKVDAHGNPVRRPVKSVLWVSAGAIAQP